jgi:hypothetical protein
MSDNPNPPDNPSSPGQAHANKGTAREESVAKLVGGKVSREEISEPNVGSTDVDVEGPNGELIAVGGSMKASNLADLGLRLRILKYVAQQRGVPALAYFETGTPQSVMDLAEKWLGSGNVFTFTP